MQEIHRGAFTSQPSPLARAPQTGLTAAAAEAPTSPSSPGIAGDRSGCRRDQQRCTDDTGVHLKGVFAALEALQQQGQLTSSSTTAASAAAVSSPLTPTTNTAADAAVSPTAASLNGVDAPTPLFCLSDGAVAWMCSRLDALWESNAAISSAPSLASSSLRSHNRQHHHQHQRAATVTAEGGSSTVSGSADPVVEAALLRSGTVVRLLALAALRAERRKQQQQLRAANMTAGEDGVGDEECAAGLSPLVRAWLWQHTAALPRPVDLPPNTSFSGDLSSLLVEWAALEIFECAQEAVAGATQRAKDVPTAATAAEEGMRGAETELQPRPRTSLPPLLLDDDVNYDVDATRALARPASTPHQLTGIGDKQAGAAQHQASSQSTSSRVLRLGVATVKEDDTCLLAGQAAQPPGPSLSLPSALAETTSAVGEGGRDGATGGPRRFAIQLFQRPPPPPPRQPQMPRSPVQPATAEEPPLRAVKLEMSKEEALLEESAVLSSSNRAALRQEAPVKEEEALENDNVERQHQTLYHHHCHKHHTTVALSQSRWRGIAPFILHVPPGSRTARNLRTVLRALGFKNHRHTSSEVCRAAAGGDAHSSLTRTLPLCPWGHLPPLVATYAWLRVSTLRQRWLRHIAAPHRLSAPAARDLLSVQSLSLPRLPAAVACDSAALQRPCFPCVAYADGRLSATLEELCGAPLSVPADWACGGSNGDDVASVGDVFRLSPTFERDLYAYLGYPLAGVAAIAPWDEEGLTRSGWEAYLCFRYGGSPSTATPAGRDKGKTSPQSGFLSADVAASLALHHRAPSAALYTAVMDLAVVLVWAELRRACAAAVEEHERHLGHRLASLGREGGASVGAAPAARHPLSLSNLAVQRVLEDVIEVDATLHRYVCSITAHHPPDCLSSCTRCTNTHHDAQTSAELASGAAYASALWLSLIAVCGLGESAIAQYVRSTLLLLTPPSAHPRVAASDITTPLAPFTLPTLFRSSLEDLHKEEVALRSRSPVVLCCPSRRTVPTTDVPSSANAAAAATVHLGLGEVLCSVSVAAAVALRHPRVFLRQAHCLWSLSSSGGDGANADFVACVGSLVECTLLAAGVGVPPPLSSPTGTVAEATATVSGGGGGGSLSKISQEEAVRVAPVPQATHAGGPRPLVVAPARPRLQLRVSSSTAAPFPVSDPVVAAASALDHTRTAVKRERAVPLSARETPVNASAQDGVLVPVHLPPLEALADICVRWSTAASGPQPLTTVTTAPPTATPLLKLVADVLWAVLQHLHSCQPMATPPPPQRPHIDDGSSSSHIEGTGMREKASCAEVATKPAASSQRSPLLPPPRRTLLLLRLPPAYAALQRLWPSLDSLPRDTAASTTCLGFSVSTSVLEVALSPSLPTPPHHTSAQAVEGSPSYADLRHYATLVASLRGVVCVQLGYAVYMILHRCWTTYAGSCDGGGKEEEAVVHVSALTWLTEQLRAFHDEVLHPLHRICSAHEETVSSTPLAAVKTPAAWLSYRPFAHVLFPRLLLTLEAALTSIDSTSRSDDTMGQSAAASAAWVALQNVRATLQQAGVVLSRGAERRL